MSRCFQPIAVSSFVFLLASLTVGNSSALAHGGVFLADVDGRVNVGGGYELFTEDQHFDLTRNVFEAIMFSSFPPFSPKDYGGDHPGFFALSSELAEMPAGAAALPAAADVSLNFTSFSVGGSSDTLFYWNGSGAVDFQPISTVQPGVALTVDPNPLDTTGSGGGLHVHPAYGLDDGGTGEPIDGVYLASPSVSVAGLVDSDPFHMVWLVDALIADEESAENVEESLESGETTVLGKDFSFFPEAVEYVQQNLAVPEPSSALLSIVAVAGMSGLLVRRRQG